ncbi:MAG: hypothetical protein K9M08_21550 [Pirellula sp.]|nr:hypothetical protein [Pirellula sp.]
MTGGLVSSVDVELLRSFYKSNKTSRAVFEILKERENDSNETKLERLEDLVRQSGVNPIRGDVVSLFKGLDRAGCGKFVVGRRQFPSRFQWHVSLRSVGIAASSEQGQVNELGPNTLEDSDEDSDLAKSESEPEKTKVDKLMHSFVLRADFRVQIILPFDLTKREADRLADFIHTLPFDDLISHFET